MAGPAPAPVDWVSALVELIDRLMPRLDDKLAAFRTSKRLARAVLINSLQREQPARLRLALDRKDPCGLVVQLAQELVGDAAQGQHGTIGLTLVLFNSASSPGSLARRLSELRACGVALTCITRLEMQARVHLLG